MWIFSKYGFFSVVVDRQNHKKLVIRTRNRRHLEHLVRRFPAVLQSIAIEDNRGTDYPFRMAVSHEAWATIASGMAREIDYTNFKSMTEVRKNYLGPRFVDALHEIWQVLWEAANPKKLNVGVWDE